MATSSYTYGSDEIPLKDCDVCIYQNVTSEAVSYCTVCSEYLCIACDKAHRGSKLTRNHKLVSEGHLPSASSTNKQTSPIMFCEEHKTMVVDMYCKSHDEVICSACKVTSHRTCNITDVSEQTKQMKKDGSLNKTKKLLEDLKSKYDSMKTMKKKEEGSFKSQLDKCLNDMRKIRKEINETLNTIENTLLKEIQNADERVTKDTEGQVAILDDVLSRIIEDLEILGESERSLDDQAMFVVMKKACTAQDKYADTMATLQQDLNQTETKLKINDTLYDSVKQMQSVEIVLVERKRLSARVTCGRPKSLLNMSITGRRDIDTGDTNVSGMTVLPDGHIVLCCGSRLKLLDNDFKVKSQLNESAWCVAAINDDDILVTQGRNKQIRKIKIFPQMKVTKTIKFDTACWGLDVYGNEMYVTCFDYDGDNGEVQVLTMTGKVKRKLGLINGKYIFKWPGYLTVNNDGSKVIVSDSSTQRVNCMDTQGQMIYQYSGADLKYPQGLFVDCDGYLLIADYHSYNVHMVTQDGSKKKIVVSESDGLKYPRCIAFRQSDRCLLVGMQITNKPTLIRYTVK